MSVNLAGTEGAAKVQPTNDWTPPACWYEPRTAEEFARHVEAVYAKTIESPGQHGYAKVAVGEFRKEYSEGKYENYNQGKSDEGSWWVSVRDESRWMEAAAQACDRPPQWVENGETPDAPEAITPQVLAELAYNQVRLPSVEVSLAPQGAAKVNLPTWAWLDSERFQEVSVTASLDVGGLHIEATTTATPVSLGLEPGTPDARTHPGSGECPIDADGSIGRPYTAGQADREPPCGVTYLRASGESGYDLHATVTWDISWTGTGGAGGDLPDGTFGGEQTVVVQEIQSVNR